MPSPLLEALGMPELSRPAGSKLSGDFGSAFRESLAGVNEDLRVIAAHAGQQEHGPFASQRETLIGAYHAASQIDDAAKHGQVLAAVSKVQEKSASKAAQVAAGRDEWLKRADVLDSSIVMSGDLEELGHPKALDFRKFTDEVIKRANNGQFQQAVAGLDQFHPKIAQEHGKFVPRATENGSATGGLSSLQSIVGVTAPENGKPLRSAGASQGPEISMAGPSDSSPFSDTQPGPPPQYNPPPFEPLKPIDNSKFPRPPASPGDGKEVSVEHALKVLRKKGPVRNSVTHDFHRRIWQDHIGLTGEPPVAFKYSGEIRIDIERLTPEQKQEWVKLDKVKNPYAYEKEPVPTKKTPSPEEGAKTPAAPPPARGPAAPSRPADSLPADAPPEEPKVKGPVVPKDPLAIPTVAEIEPERVLKLAAIEKNQVFASKDSKTHQQAWSLLLKKPKTAPIAFIVNKQVYVDMRRWKKAGLPALATVYPPGVKRIPDPPAVPGDKPGQAKTGASPPEKGPSSPGLPPASGGGGDPNKARFESGRRDAGKPKGDEGSAPKEPVRPRKLSPEQTPTRPPTYGNVPLEGPSTGRTIDMVDLVERNGAWRAIAPGGKGSTARGKYLFVVLDDNRIFAAKPGSTDRFGKLIGHTELAQGGRVAWAGVIEFEGGKLKIWNNGSGHYTPSGTASQVPNNPPPHPGLTWDKFDWKYKGPDRREGQPKRGPQLPVHQEPTKPRTQPTPPSVKGPADGGEARKAHTTSPQTSNPPSPPEAPKAPDAKLLNEAEAIVRRGEDWGTKLKTAYENSKKGRDVSKDLAAAQKEVELVRRDAEAFAKKVTSLPEFSEIADKDSKKFFDKVRKNFASIAGSGLGPSLFKLSGVYFDVEGILHIARADGLVDGIRRAGQFGINQSKGALTTALASRVFATKTLGGTAAWGTAFALADLLCDGEECRRREREAEEQAKTEQAKLELKAARDLRMDIGRYLEKNAPKGTVQVHEAEGGNEEYVQVLDQKLWNTVVQGIDQMQREHYAKLKKDWLRPAKENGLKDGLTGGWGKQHWYQGWKDYRNISAVQEGELLDAYKEARAEGEAKRKAAVARARDAGFKDGSAGKAMNLETIQQWPEVKELEHEMDTTVRQQTHGDYYKSYIEGYNKGATKALTHLAISPDPLTMGANTSKEITATGVYADGSTEILTFGVEWTCEPKNAISFKKINGALFAVASNPGGATITAKPRYKVDGREIKGETIVTIEQTTSGQTTDDMFGLNAGSK